MNRRRRRITTVRGGKSSLKTSHALFVVRAQRGNVECGFGSFARTAKAPLKQRSTVPRRACSGVIFRRTLSDPLHGRPGRDCAPRGAATTPPPQSAPASAAALAAAGTHPSHLDRAVEEGQAPAADLCNAHRVDRSYSPSPAAAPPHGRRPLRPADRVAPCQQAVAADARAQPRRQIRRPRRRCCRLAPTCLGRWRWERLGGDLHCRHCRCRRRQRRPTCLRRVACSSPSLHTSRRQSAAGGGGGGGNGPPVYDDGGTVAHRRTGLPYVPWPCTRPQQTTALAVAGGSGLGRGRGVAAPWRRKIFHGSCQCRDAYRGSVSLGRS